MKKLLTLITIITLTATLAKAQDSWVVYKVDNHFSLKFPKQPATLIPGTIGTITADTVGCDITVVDLNKVANVDSATVSTIKEDPEFADQIRVGMQQGAKVQLEPLKLGTWHGLTSYTSSGTDNTNKKFTMLMIVYSTTIYNIFTIIPPNSKSKAGEIFFNSITFTK